MELRETILARLHGQDKNGRITCYCPFHEMPDFKNHNPSLGVDIEKRMATCWSQRCVTGRPGFYQVLKYLGIQQEDPSKQCKDVIDRNKLFNWQRALQQVDVANLMWDRDTAFKLGIGWAYKGYQIPVFTDEGVIGKLYTYRPGKPQEDKYKFKEDPNFPPTLYPSKQYREEFFGDTKFVFIAEGHGDCIALLSQELPVVTAGGVHDWKNSHTEQFVKEFPQTTPILIPDNDISGRNFGRTLIKQFQKHPGLNPIWLTPPEDVNDITDALRAGYSFPEDFEQYSEPADPGTSDTDTLLNADGSCRDIQMEEVFKQGEGELIHTSATPIALGELVYGANTHIEIRCCQTSCKTCAACDYGTGIVLQLTPKMLLASLGVSEESRRAKFKAMLGISKNCPGVNFIGAEKGKEISVRDIFIARPSKSDTKNSEGVSHIPAVIMSDHLELNKDYEFKGRRFIHPKDQSQVFFINDFIPSDYVGEAERCPELPYSDPLDIVADLSYNVTGIYQRPMLHLSYLLAWFSPLQLRYEQDSKVEKGYIETLVVGDSECGKSDALRSLTDFFDQGAIVNPARATIAGIMGGVRTLGNRRMAVAGTISMMDGKIMSIEEFDKAGEDFLKALRDTRESGKVEINTIEQAKYNARTRLICLMNPAGGKLTMSAYRYGIESVFGLTRYAPDIRRFDHVHITKVLPDTVSLRRADQEKVAHKYTQEIGRKHLQWVWNLKADDIKVTDEAYTLCASLGSDLSSKAHSVLPLLTTVGAPIKLLKMATSFAALSGTCSEDREKLIVTADHVKTAHTFFAMEYSAEENAYFAYSEEQRKHEQIPEPGKLLTSINTSFVHPRKAAEHLHSTNNFISFRHLKYYLDRECTVPGVADTIYRDLKYNNCFREAGKENMYKTEAFTEFLRENIDRFSDAAETLTDMREV